MCTVGVGVVVVMRQMRLRLHIFGFNVQFTALYRKKKRKICGTDIMYDVDKTDGSTVGNNNGTTYHASPPPRSHGHCMR